jgi:2-oxoglutarate dehydrogenase E2 component (dihydrolipoamide succinyltransferase)
MPTPVKMPQLGETVFEGTVARWLKQPGDPVQRQEPLLDITTDKIDTEVPAPAAGFLLKILAAEGATVQVGSVIAYIGDKEDEITEETEGPGKAEELSEETDRPATSVSLPASRRAREAASDAKPEGRAFVSPVVARLSAEHNIDLDAVQGSGRQGRVTKKDLLAYIEAAKKTAARSAARCRRRARRRRNTAAPLEHAAGDCRTHEPQRPHEPPRCNDLRGRYDGRRAPQSGPQRESCAKRD